MANPHKGEVSAEIAGTSYKFVLSVNGICAVEDLLNRTWLDICVELGSWGPKTGKDGKPIEESDIDRARRIKTSLVRALFWAGLQEHHGSVTLKQAGGLMGQVSTEGGPLGIVLRLFDLALPESDKDTPENPPKPGNPSHGTGPAPVSNGAASV